MSQDSTSNEGLSDFSEFLADYLIEAEEHLAAARRCVLQLETGLEKSDIDQAVLDELFRSFHTLKGLSAMVEFREAEQLAHQLESYLSALRKHDAQLQLPGLEALVAGVAALDRAIAAQRDSGPPPDNSTLKDQLAGLLPAIAGQSNADLAVRDKKSDSARLTDGLDARIAAKLQGGARAWRIRFEPSSELVGRGIDVNTVRAKLRELGDLVHSEPLIGADGGVAFAFVIVTMRSAEEVLSHQGDGITLEEFQRPAIQLPADEPVPVRSAIPTKQLSSASLVRVDLARLDELMRVVGELVLSRARLDDGLQRIESMAPAAEVRSLKETNAAIERQLRDLREGVMQVRMVPVREVFTRMQFVVRDLARETGKGAELGLMGEETQIDKYIVERIMDPLLHLVRNAVSHGLESSAERITAGKSPAGRIELRAATTGDRVMIEVEDNGRGIDESAVLQEAKTKGIAEPAHDGSTLDILCTPGFSTRAEIDRASGRGVGMDVVRRTVEELGGELSMQTAIGRGTCFTIQLPLTLAIIDALIVAVGNERYAVPQTSVREVLKVEPGTIRRLENNEIIPHHRSVLTLVQLSEIFNIHTDNDAPYALVVGEGERRAALAVDRVLTLREIVVRPLTDRVSQVPGIAGATELGDGRVVLILDTAKLFRTPKPLTATALLEASSV